MSRTNVFDDDLRSALPSRGTKSEPHQFRTDPDCSEEVTWRGASLNEVALHRSARSVREGRSRNLVRRHR